MFTALSSSAMNKGRSYTGNTDIRHMDSTVNLMSVTYSIPESGVSSTDFELRDRAGPVFAVSALNLCMI